MTSDRRPRRLRAAAALLLAAALAVPGPAGAHPHAWIDVTVDVLFDPSGRAVTALHEHWLFDEYYTAYAVEGLDGNGDGQPDADKLAALLAENMTNLKDYDYFTRVESDGAALGFAPVTEMSSRMIDNRLEMSFVVRLDAPVSTVAAPLVYRVFDPTYYIEVLHAESPDPIRLVGAADGCTHHLAQPDPDPEAVTLAAALDATASAGDALGILFSEKVTIRCAAPR